MIGQTVPLTSLALDNARHKTLILVPGFVGQSSALSIQELDYPDISLASTQDPTFALLLYRTTTSTMSDAQWYPLFVTAKVPIEVIDRILEHAQTESRESDDFFTKPWVLIQSPNQQTFSKPTLPPLTAFSTGFLDSSPGEPQAFVIQTFGPEGRGHGNSAGMDYLADDSFGVIDSRTATDDTILFFAPEHIAKVQELELKVSWDLASADEQALVRFANGEDSDEDVKLLMQQLFGAEVVEDLDGAREQLQKRVDGMREVEELRWMEFRIDARKAVWCAAGIYQRGAFDSKLVREDFDEQGVMSTDVMLGN